MKRLLSSKKFIQKIFISIIIVLLFSFAVPVRSQAGIGGILFDPLVDLVGTIFDAVVGGLQMFLMNGEFNEVDGDDNGFLNAFMVNKDKFEENEGGKYNEFKSSNADKEAEVTISEEDLDSKYYIPVLKYSPEKIFSGLVPALDIDFVNPTDWENAKDEDGNLIYENGSTMNELSIARELHQTIAKWYVALRNLAIVGLMLVLVYVGIRIVISSTAADKSKYKQMLMDWLIALCLLFCLHYIMTFTTTIVNEISQAINGSNSNNGNNVSVTVQDSSGSEKVSFNTDLMGLIRFRMQSNNGFDKAIYLIFYMAMVIYTCMFTFTYLKRVLIMAFLTIISPLVALTYPIDKMRDGKAQAFDMWLKEYVFNALLQPFHLIIYTVFIGAGIDLAAKNPIFAIVAMAFLTPAEKILRKFFGFEKASTAGALGFAGGATAMGLAQRLLAPKGSKGGKGKESIRTKKTPEGDVDSLAESLGGKSGGKPIRENNNGEAIAAGRTNISMSNNSFTGNSKPFGSVQETSDGLTDGYHQSGGLYIPDEDIRGITEPTTPQTNPTPSQSQIHGKGAWQWSDDDTRGLGQYLGDAAKYKANQVGRWAANTGVGKQAIRIGTAAKGTAQAFRDDANVRREQSRKDQEKWMSERSKPFQNSARTLGNNLEKIGKGTLNVAKKTGIAAGKGALKAAGRAASAVPGAMFGMAAGIAGDQLSDITKYTAAGAALTSTVGHNAIGSAVSSAGSFVSSAYKEGAYGSDEAAIEQVEKAYVKSNEWDAVYKHEFKNDDGSSLSRADLKAKKQQGAFYAARGIDGEDAIKAVKLEDKIKKELGPENENLDSQQYTARIMKIAKSYSADKLRKDSEVKSLTSSIEKELINGGFDKKGATEQAKMAVKYIKAAKGVKDN